MPARVYFVQTLFRVSALFAKFFSRGSLRDQGSFTEHGQKHGQIQGRPPYPETRIFAICGKQIVFEDQAGKGEKHLRQLNVSIRLAARRDTTCDAMIESISDPIEERDRREKVVLLSELV